MKNRWLLYLLFLLLLVSCGYDPWDYYDKALISPNPVNLSAVNSIYDDYNSNFPQRFRVGVDVPFFFSSNRKTQGKSFDILHYGFKLSYDEISNDYEVGAFEVSEKSIDSINSEWNELGPYLTPNSYDNLGHAFDYYTKKLLINKSYPFLFASDRTGNLDIYFNEISFQKDSSYKYKSYIGKYYESYQQYIRFFNFSAKCNSVKSLNSPFDDAYPTYVVDASGNYPKNIIYFCSNRGGNFDIYKAECPTDQDMLDSLSNVTISKVDILNSEKDDKCPYIVDNVMYFTSKRDGGLGGFDLWYSIYDGTNWSQPVNMGSKINSSSDEYRPVVALTNRKSFFNNLLIFSSNRPGGLGGYDLYYAGIKPLQ